MLAREGVGGATILVTAARNNPKRIRSEAVFTALCGFCPLPASAGKTNRQLLNRSGNCQTNAELHRIAVVRLRWHKQTQSYAARRIGEGLRTLKNQDSRLPQTIHGT
ncbi:transposase [Microcystis elabens FACHB-917]|nr:transposase [Microcystis elabens FACHB-917]